MGGGGGAGPGEVPAVAGAGGEVEGEDGWESGTGEEEGVDEGDGEGGKAVVQPCHRPHFHLHGSASSASSLHPPINQIVSFQTDELLGQPTRFRASPPTPRNLRAPRAVTNR